MAPSRQSLKTGARDGDRHRFPSFVIRLPVWIDDELPRARHRFASVEARMELVIRLARANAARGTGGPFAAAVFNAETQHLIAPGVNLVTSLGSSIVHAEIVALAIAQRILGHFDLGAPGLPRCELVTSTEPCAMCLGAIPWSGIRRLVCGARESDARAVGFDEGPKVPDWRRALEDRGIAVVQDVGRDPNILVLQEYVRAGGIVYNGRGQRVSAGSP